MDEHISSWCERKGKGREEKKRKAYLCKAVNATPTARRAGRGVMAEIAGRASSKGVAESASQRAWC